MWLNGRSYSKRINRLVAEAFIPNPENKPEVNHKDCNKLNNYYTNLEWLTHEEHEKHTTLNGLHPKGINIGTHKLSEKQVFEIRKKYLIGNISQRKLAKEFNVCQSTVGYLLRNETWKNL